MVGGFSSDVTGQVLEALAELLPDDAPAVTVDQPLRGLGLDSLAITRLWFGLQSRIGVDIAVERLRQCATAAEIVELVGPSASASRPQTAQPAAAGSAETFPLTDLQQAYFLGKQPEFGDDTVGCHIYREFEVRDLDAARLEQAWLRLVAHHPMLRARIDADGTGRILPDVDSWSMTVRTSEDRAQVRSVMRAAAFSATAFPLFDVAVSAAQNNVSTVHLSIDAAIVDGPSVRLLLRQWCALYDDPEAELSASTLSAAECVEAIDAATQRASDDREYWCERLAGAVYGPTPRPGAPAFVPADTRGGRCPGRRTLLTDLDADAWRAVRDLAARHDVSPTALVLTVFSEVLARRTDAPGFTLILTTSHRPRLPRAVDELVAPLTSTMLFTAPDVGELPFAEALRAVHARLWEGLDHAAISGIAALRAAHSSGRQPALPVVFTSELDTAADQWAGARASFAESLIYGASQTSGVTLDHQMWELTDGGLGIRWDVVPSAWPAGWTEAAFAELLNRLLALGAVAAATDRPLNELQQSYVVGRASSGRAWNGCQVFHAFDVEHFELDRLERAWLDLTEQHDVLRSWIGDDGRLHVGTHAPSRRFICVLASDEIDDAALFVRASADELVSVGLPMDRGSQADLRVIRRADGSATVFCLLDLLAIDGRSIHMLMRDLFDRYADPSRPLRRHGTYAEWTERRRAIASGSEPPLLDANGAMEHWRRRMAELVPGPALTRGELRARTRFVFEREGWNAVDEALREAGFDADAMLAAALAESVATRYAGGFSFPVVRWTQASAPYRPGEYTALSWLTAQPSARATYDTARAYARTLAEDAAADGISGLTELRRHVMRHRSSGGFELPIVYTSLLDLTEQPLPGGVTAGSWLTCTPDVALDCVSIREGDRLSLYWDVVVDDFPSGAAAAMFARYREIVAALGTVDELAAGDGHPRVDAFNDTARPFEDDYPVQHLFEQWVLHQPAAPAVQSSRGTLSYAELNAYANRIARALRELGIGPEVAVGISTPRGPAMIAAVFGVLKAGGLYVPIEPGLPVGRAAAILEDAGISLLLTTSERDGWRAPEHVQTLEVDSLPPDAALDAENPPQEPTSARTAYVIFTSGSTGRPKGVAVTHRPVLNLIDWCRRTYRFGPGDLGLCVTSLGFDLSVFDLLGLLGLGAAVYVADEAERKDPELLARLLAERPITFWNSAPTTLNQLAPELTRLAGQPGTDDLRLVFLSGDYTPLTLPDKIRAVFGRAQIVSLGGATEATVWSNYFPVGEIDPAWTSIPYGTPISNARYYILDAGLRPCPIGVEGDLYIGGECLSSGYYRLPELTAERFIRDPFVTADAATMYRTGDRAVYYPDGVIGFRGRQDNQVKIRGYRVEPEEIEHRLRAHPSVADVVVLARRDAAGDTRLVAYVIAAAGAEVEPGPLRWHAAEALPDYMVPNVVVQIDGFPATHNGKLDRDALPWPVATGTRHTLLTAPTAPAPAAAPDALVAELAGVFAELLEAEVDPAADLWDQGATSFTMVQVARILKERHGFAISVAALLDEPTVAGIAARVGGGSTSAAADPAPTSVEPGSVDFFSAEDRARFKAGQWNRRRPQPGERTVEVPVSTFVDAYRPYRATRRDFLDEPLTLDSLTGLLSVLADSSGRLYPSAGDTYAVQVYVHVPEGGVTDLPGGAYYYDPTDHQLRCLRLGAVLDRSAHFVYNRELHDAARVSLYLVGEGRGINPLYGTHSERFLLLEAGYLAQSLMLAQAAHGIGLCPVGDVAEAAVREAFDLPGSAVYLHALLGGRVSREIGPVPPPFSALPPAAEPTTFTDPIAVIGIAGCYPGASDLDSLWRDLYAGTSAIGPVPGARRGSIGTDADRSGLVGGFLEPTLISAFDSLAFGIAPAEVPTLDPQLRLLLRAAWECLDDAGHTPESLRRAGRVGVFLGAMWQDHQHVGVDLRHAGETARISATASDAAGRISHVFGFTGPSVAVDTACSSALSALHLAVASLRRGECEVALVAAANLFGHPYHLDLLSGLDLLRDTDTPGAYDESSPGWLPGEGVGAVLLRAEDVARAAGDVRHAVIEATALGHIGGAGSRFSAPSAARLAESIGELLEAAQLRAEDIDYVECAAAGAVLADAAELEALTDVFGDAAADRPQPLAFGTVKPNLGHLEAAAGLAQLTKVILQLRHQTFAPTLLSKRGGTLLDIDPTKLAAVRAAEPWTRHVADRPRRALVNAVAAAGSFAHVVVREPTAERPRPAAPPVPQLIVLSADSPARLRAAAAQLADALANAEYRLADVAITLQTGRRARRHRLAVISLQTTEVIRVLRRFADDAADAGVRTADAPVVATTAPTTPSTLADAARAWLAGEQVDWHAMWADGQARRVSLPSHQFALADDESPAVVVVAPAAQPHTPQRNADAVLEHIVRVFCEVTGTPADRVHPRAPLGDYGLSSVLIAGINARLQREYGSVPSTLFFDRPDLASIAEDLSAIPSPHSPGVAANAPVAADERIAIIGVAGRYPDARDLDTFWCNVAEGRDSIRSSPPAGRRPTGERAEQMWGGYLDDIELFDPMLFGITPRDAELMDPQERLFLEVCWRLWEISGYSPRRLHARHGGRVGVFAGSMYNEYPLFGAEVAAPNAPSTGSALAGIANRVSYTFGLTGPSMTVDTMCSSSLTAIHLAVQSLLSGECELAVAGGVNLSLHPNKFRQQRQLGMTSSDHRCRAFGAGGDGFVPGEGVGAVLIKPLTRAVADRDPVLAVILGSAVNHGGHSNGYMVPSVPAQAEVLGRALDRAGVPAESIGYLEAHGTGTALGDPIELEALARALRLGEGDHVLPIGSVKSNIGHLEAAAGIAGLTKVLLQFEHGQLAPSLHADELNPNIDWQHVPFRVQRELRPWPAPESEDVPARRAGISSFGAGGSNAHLIVEQADRRDTTAPQGSAHALDNVFILSARTSDQLREVAARLAQALIDEPEPALPDVAYTLRAARVALAHRAAIVTDSRAQLIGELKRLADSAAATDATMIGRAPTALGGLHQQRERLPEAADATPADLARHWVSGGDLPIGEPRTIVRLPGYPFARVRCWAPVDASPAISDDVFLWTKDWAPSDDESGLIEPAVSDLILCLATESQSQLAKAVSAVLAPATVVRLVPETAADDLKSLPEDRAVTGWIDLTALTDDGPDWQVVLPLLQHILRRRPQAPLRALQLTTGLFGPSTAPAARCAGAAMAGFVRALGAEFGRITANVLDIDVPEDAPGAVAGTVHEAFRRRPAHGEIAVRGGRHYAPVLRELPPPSARAALDPDRVYVVSGGTRGLGALVAEHLVERGARRLAVLGRHRPEPGTTRAEELSAAHARLEGRGVRVLTYFGPLTADGGIAEFLDEVRGTLGPIAGVVHCAGRARSRPASFVSLDLSEMAEIWEPKAAGFDTLAGLCEKERPDFFVSFSSVSAALPKLAAGVADYAAANAYLDYAAGDYRFRSIDWPVWSESGSASGGVARGDSITDARGLAVLDHVLATAVRGPVLVTVGAQSPAPDALAVNIRQPRSAPAPMPVAAAAAAAPSWLGELFGTALRVPAAELDPDVSFAELGIESVLLAEIVAKLEERLGRSVNPAVLLEHPTLNQLSRGLDLPTEERPSSVAACAPTVHATAPDRRIAVVGIGCRFPGAEGVDGFWQLLRTGECAVGEVPASRWDIDQFYDPAGGPGRTPSRWGGFVDGVEDFDPEYFGMTDAQARDLDPAIRLSLETAVAAVCDAGYRAEELAGRRVGVYLGARMSGYRRRLSAEERARSLGGDQNFIAAWLAHHFDLHGPSLVVDSACSSSLVSVQMAVQSLLDGSSELALAGGVEVLLDEEPYLDFGAAGALSPRGRCAGFGSGADGFVPGEGCGLLLLKTLTDALRDGDRVHGVIDAVAVGNDGRTMGLTTPNPVAQADVVRRALTASGYRPSAVGLIEAHGTATRIGDPMELRALETVWAEDEGTRGRIGTCALGTVKSNLGHLFSAAGAAGLIKALLAVRNAQIPPTLFCEEPHPRCNFERSVFAPAQALRPWPGHGDGVPRVAGVSAFGLGGTNAHAVVSSAPQRDPATVTRVPLPPPEFRRRRLWREREDRPGERREPVATAAAPPLSRRVTSPPPPMPRPADTPPSRLVASLLDIAFSPSPRAAGVSASEEVR
jgi:amino acid adenylation domain-containing protein